jgi:hypothetical protein
MDHTASAFPPPPDLPPALETRPEVRFLHLSDLPALLELEHDKWDDDQAASPADLSARIIANPGLSVGAFCPRAGRILASLFLRPVVAGFWRHTASWRDCTELPVPVRSASLFGISLSSRDAAAVDAILQFFWPHALKGGWRHIYLGSPVPGLRDWLARHPGGCAEEYAALKRGGLPLDPQLRYYHSRGFKEIVCVKPGYFPHERSLDHGAILRGTIPLSALVPVWRALPLASTRRVTRQLSSLL